MLNKSWIQEKLHDGENNFVQKVHFVVDELLPGEYSSFWLLEVFNEKSSAQEKKFHYRFFIKLPIHSPIKVYFEGKKKCNSSWPILYFILHYVK